ncbi:unnamed protein product [Rotaria magnacalcarata]|uniref:F-box domain-containing protein n=3 Tax=Rotaria magnacalcarata TaxID=392030 RepID=A0A816BCM4_9BILA|nr:unnamed protein product [Rotaria magnacalcarata]CAF1608716.1 unnamed protein product [Rotaria magnacalcarata]CAF2081708.1 unnamed protein product [Rotaria magnacalcarata]CAF2140119.1 unnamed protein product [Rotaria magnacalcarata]CAF2160869.1 unnamed protein product [Rotaria magnacalcarata]
MILFIFGLCICTLIIIGWKLFLSSQSFERQSQALSDIIEQSENASLSVDDTIQNDELQTPSTNIICDAQDNSVVPSVLEHLPDEILLDIISYLKPYDIYHSLHDLNNRFNSIISDFQLSLNMDISHISKNEFDYCLSSVLPLPSVLLRLHSLHISNDETYGAIALFIRQYPCLHIPSLRSLSLTDATMSQIKFLFLRLSTQIEHVSIVTNRTIDMNEKRLLCQLILKHKTLRSCRLSLCDGVDCDETILNNSINNQLENIVIDLSYFQNILTLLSYIPNAKRLTININQQKYYNQDYDAAAFDIFRLSIPTQLTYFNLNLRFSNVEFEHIEQLLNCLVNLKHLCCSSFRVELVDGYRWAQVLERLPLLRRFECVMTTYIYHSLDLNLISQSFQTLFWKEKNWSVVCDYFQHLSRLIIYTIPFYKNLFTSTLNGSQSLNDCDDGNTLPCNAYDRVTHLKVSVQGLHSDNIPVRKFRFVTSLSLCDGESYSDHSNSSLLSYLTSTIDLTKIRHLKLNSLLSGHTLFSLLCKAPNIDGLSSSYHNLLQMINDFGDVWLCWLLNMMIKRLTLSYGRLTLSIVDQFIELFSNIEHLSLCMNMDDVDFQEILLKLLQNLTHLSSIRISLAGKLTDHFQSQTVTWLSNNQELHSEFNDNFLDIWIT